MQRYYRTVMDLSRLNEMLLQLFEEAILMDPDATPTPLNERFQVKNGYLQTADEQVFANEPSALLELFLLLQQNPDIRGVSAYTIGLDQTPPASHRRGVSAKSAQSPPVSAILRHRRVSRTNYGA